MHCEPRELHLQLPREVRRQELQPPRGTLASDGPAGGPSGKYVVQRPSESFESQRWKRRCGLAAHAQPHAVRQSSGASMPETAARCTRPVRELTTNGGTSSRPAAASGAAC